MDGWMNGEMDGWRDGWMDEWMERWMNEWMSGRMEGWRDGGMEGWRDGGREKKNGRNNLDFEVTATLCLVAINHFSLSHSPPPTPNFCLQIS